MTEPTIAQQQESAQRMMLQAALSASRFELDCSEIAKTAAIAAYGLALDHHRSLMRLNGIEVGTHE